MALIQNDLQFVSVDYIKNNSPLPRFLDENYLTYAITEAQNIELQNVIGTPLYQSIYDKDIAYLSSGTSMAAEYDTLITTYCKPFIMNYAVYRALDNIYAKVMNTSITIKKDANMGDIVTKNMVDSERSRYLKLAMFSRDMLTRYLITQNQHGYFPEWTSYIADPDTVLPDRGSGYGKQGIYLKRRGKGSNRYGFYPGDSTTLNGSSSSAERGTFTGDYFR